MTIDFNGMSQSSTNIPTFSLDKVLNKTTSNKKKKKDVKKKKNQQKDIN